MKKTLKERNMKKIVLQGKGDNNWKESFDSEEKAFWFLYSKLSGVERYFSDSLKHDSFVFDIEDDIIIWKQGGKEKYCAGWHWMEEQDKEQIIMPNGNTLYEMFCELEN